MQIARMPYSCRDCMSAPLSPVVQAAGKVASASVVGIMVERLKPALMLLRGGCAAAHSCMQRFCHAGEGRTCLLLWQRCARLPYSEWMYAHSALLSHEYQKPQ